MSDKSFLKIYIENEAERNAIHKLAELKGYKSTSKYIKNLIHDDNQKQRDTFKRTLKEVTSANI